MGRSSLRVWMGALVCALAVAGASAPGLAAEEAGGATEYEQGRLLSQRWQQPRPVSNSMGLVTTSDQYVAHNYYQRAEGEPTELLVHRISDGALVRVLPNPRPMSNLEPRLVGGTWVQEVEDPATGRVSEVHVYAVETGEQMARFTIPVGERLVATGDDWMLTSGPADGFQNRPLVLRRAEGTQTRFPDVLVTTSVRTHVLDAGAVLVKDQQGRMWHIDAVKGYATPQTYTEPTVVAADRLFWVESAASASGSTNRVTWRNVDGSGFGSVETANLTWPQTFLPYGNRIALLHVPSDGDAWNKALSPLNLSTGEVEPAVADHIGWARPAGHGQLMLALADTVTGRLAVVDDDGLGPRTVTELPPVALPVRYLRLSGGVAAATYSNDLNNPEPGTVWFSQPDSSESGWREDLLGQPVTTDPEGNIFDFSGEVALTALPEGGTGGADPYQLTWPGGSRDVVGAYGNIQLGNGGLLLGRGLLSSSGGYVDGWQVEDVRTGQVKARFEGQDPRIALDGRWIWQGPDAEGTMTGTDTAAPGSVRTVRTGLTDCPATPSVVGRWALLSCGVGRTYVVDLLGVLEPWQVPVQQDDRGVVLGGGFVAWMTFPQGTGQAPALKVADLAPGHTTRVYGPVRGRYYPPGPSYTADDTGAPQLVYADAHSQPRLLSLDWLQPAPTTRPDTTAPQLDALSGSPRYLAATGDRTAVSFDWAFSDPSSDVEPGHEVAAYDVRYRQATAGDQPGDAWVAPAAWQGTTSTSASVEVEGGTETCWQVRAQDTLGNLSEWTSERCTVVDAVTPTITDATAGPAVLNRPWLSTVTFTFSATDEIGVASHEVSYRQAGARGDLGAWATPPRWRATTATTAQRRVMPGGQVCFRVRAADHAGHRSSWTTPRCAAVPFDDSDLTARGRVSTPYARKAMGGSEAVLRRGASLHRSRLTGRVVAVHTTRSARAGVLEVYVDRRRLARVNLQAPRTRRTVVYVRSPRKWYGQVRLVSPTARPVRVDGMAVLR